MKKGVSGILRVKNDAEFIETCIDSCIDALDELIVVYNDCTDNSPELIEKKRKQYPEKIKVYEYKYKVYSIGLTKEEYEYALSLPEDSPHLLCNYYNYALSKVTSEFALKIDADQIYYTSKLKELCDYCRCTNTFRKDVKYWLGKFFHFYFLFYRFLSIKIKKRIPILPSCIIKIFKESYETYAKYQLLNANACFSLSGLNVFKDKEWFVSLGRVNDIINILPPYNGENDHLIFRVTPTVYYRTFKMSYYNKLRSSNYSLIEEFVHPYKPMFMGFAWFHLNAMRNNCRSRVSEVKNKYPESFIEINQFIESNYSDIEKQCDREMHTLYQRLLFSYIHNAYSYTVKEFLTLLNHIQ